MDTLSVFLGERLCGARNPQGFLGGISIDSVSWIAGVPFVPLPRLLS